LVTFARGDIPLAAALVLDASGSMAGERLEAALAGAKTFVRGMRELDEAAVFLFSDDLLRSTDFSGDSRVHEVALDQVEARGRATAINDHLYMALKQLDTRQGRRVVLLLSDGADVHSVLRMEQVLWKAQRSQALIYWIRLEEEGRYDGGRFNSTWRNYLDNEKEWDLLEQSVKDSGGRIVRASVSGVEDAFKEILAELREQYVLGYYPSNIRNDGSWHGVKVRASGGSYNIRTRNGYID
jgi:Ca-activated chloride channel family protein